MNRNINVLVDEKDFIEEDGGSIVEEESSEEESSEEESSEEESKLTKKRPREYYEQAYIDFVRFKYPKTEDFVTFVNLEFSKEGYSVIDHMSQLTKDTKCCLMNYLNVYDICSLAMTCSAFAKTTQTTNYNDYWKGRFLKACPNYYIDNGGNFTYKKKKMSILWFDVFQYSMIEHKLGLPFQTRKRLLNGKQTFHTFVKWKRKGAFPNSFKIDVRTSRSDIKTQICKEFMLDIDPNFIALLDSSSATTPFTKKKKKQTNQMSLNDLRAKLYKYVYDNFKRYTDEDLEQLKGDMRQYNYDYRDDKLCFFDIPQEFLEKWGLQTKTVEGRGCLCRVPYYNSYRPTEINTIDDLYTHSSRLDHCIAQRCTGAITQPLLQELFNYGIDIYARYFSL
jgi:hypothetical protein